MGYASTSSDTSRGVALGVASIGIGLTELLAPDKVQDLLGIEKRATHSGILRALGVRELMHGISLLSDNTNRRKTAVGLWARVLGDVLDTALLAAAAQKTKKPQQFAAVAASVMGIGIADVVAAKNTTLGNN